MAVKQREKLVVPPVHIGMLGWPVKGPHGVPTGFVECRREGRYFVLEVHGEGTMDAEQLRDIATGLLGMAEG